MYSKELTLIEINVLQMHEMNYNFCFLRSHCQCENTNNM